MSVVINTNVDALKIQNNVNSATRKLSQAMERMSSGLKVNSAKDDAAGAVISAKMDVQLNGNKIAQNNVQNANAMLSTAEGNLNTIEDNLSRIRDLTLQAKNGTYSEDEIQAMQDEVKERIAEINRISHSASYSSLKLFGAADIDLTTFNSTELAAITDAYKGVKALTSVSATGAKDVSDYKTEGSGADQVASFSFNGKDYSFKTAAQPGEAIETETKPADTSRAIIVDQQTNDDGTVTFLRKKESTTYSAVSDGKSTPSTTTTYDVVTVEGSQLSKDGAKFQVGANAGEDNTITANKDLFASVEFGALTGMTTFDLTQCSSSADFDDALLSMDKAIDNITSRKSLIGSAGNRLDSALDTLTIQYENLSSAKSIIMDADIAQEASTFTQQQILQEVSVALLAQANQAPSIALSLV